MLIHFYLEFTARDILQSGDYTVEKMILHYVKVKHQDKSN